VTVVVRRRCSDRREAEALRAAVVADNPAYVEVAAEDRDLVVRVSAASAASARTTLEDLLACLKAAERTAGLAKPS
jgi:hypothetical protein